MSAQQNRVKCDWTVKYKCKKYVVILNVMFLSQQSRVKCDWKVKYKCKRYVVMLNVMFISQQSRVKCDWKVGYRSDWQAYTRGRSPRPYKYKNTVRNPKEERWNSDKLNRNGVCLSPFYCKFKIMIHDWQKHCRNTMDIELLNLNFQPILKNIDSTPTPTSTSIGSLVMSRN